MDAETGIPYPEFHTRNVQGNEMAVLAIHDLQEPVTMVTHDIPPEKRATKGAVLAAEKLAESILLLRHPESRGVSGEPHDKWLIEWGTYFVEIAELFRKFSEDVLKESHDLKN